mmetsp:Transcript_17226/g.53547  ORF Transcript_17226/g.53547 Transcript_17226/m.53547 type:complete len:206 (+) Transcript_17226:1475-2092(+)
MAADYQIMAAKRKDVRRAHVALEADDPDQVRREAVQAVAARVHDTPAARFLLLAALPGQRRAVRDVRDGRAQLGARNADSLHRGWPARAAPEAAKVREPARLHGAHHSVLERRDRAGGDRAGEERAHLELGERDPRADDAPVRHPRRADCRRRDPDRRAAHLRRARKVHTAARRSRGRRERPASAVQFWFKRPPALPAVHCGVRR